MNRYYFHTRNGATSMDAVGVELDTDEQARAEALTVLGEFLRFGPPDLWKAGVFTIVVEREGGAVTAVLNTTASRETPEDWPWE